ncbi:hypothetical protein V5P93_004443 [Actinokineospora auranticolor]|uniref:Putative HAF family extracellular repeat protein n=1 Tax=Actinokineospora auranticolor TaxID=155976 RepID=A0A2S6GTB0_9PSEU|nr:hypothetical protein [Actinokineospora auranticolor]PPK68450.1 putative HAF family extracellular repeat protein [Actinokineospora auranticolor]
MSRNAFRSRFPATTVAGGAVALAIVGGGLATPAHAATTRYTLTIGPAGTQRYLGINDNGDIIGAGFEPGAEVGGEGFVIKAGTNTPQFLSTADNPGNTQQFTAPHAIDNAGVVVGFRRPPGSTEPGLGRPMKWQAPGNGVDLGVDQSPTSDVEATGINDNGLIVGKTLTSNDRTTAWTLNGSIFTRLPNLPGAGNNARADAVNKSGLVVGSATTATTFPAVAWVNGQIKVLGTLPGGTFAEAKAVNSAGVAVGVSTTTGGNEFGVGHAVMFAGGTVTDLHFPGTDTNSGSANGINDAGTVVGSVSGFDAFVYQNGVVTDLNTLIPANSGFTIVGANAINNKGQIVGEAFKNGTSHRTTFAVLLTPTGQ